MKIEKKKLWQYKNLVIYQNGISIQKGNPHSTIKLTELSEITEKPLVALD